jgi:hypothetical protein
MNYADWKSKAAPGNPTHVARLLLAAFLLTFLAARVLVLLIMSRRIPDLYVHAGGTHIHHLNYGIFLLSAVGAWLVLFQPKGRALEWAAGVFGVGLALTFDEFGMWVHLGGSYWQRASFDAMTVIATLLGLLAYAPAIRRFRPHHWITAMLIAVAAAAFFALLTESLKYANRVVAPKLHRIESTAPR